MPFSNEKKLKHFLGRGFAKNPGYAYDYGQVVHTPVAKQYVVPTGELCSWKSDRSGVSTTMYHRRVVYLPTCSVVSYQRKISTQFIPRSSTAHFTLTRKGCH